MSITRPKLGGKKAPEKTNIDKWTDGIAQQLSQPSERINVKMVPLDQVQLDPNNARMFNLSYEEIKQGPKLSDYQASEGIDNVTFEKEVSAYFEKDQLKIAEYLKLAVLAESIGSPSGLINPVTTYLDEMRFVLIAGHRRTLAHWILGANVIAAKILEQRPTELSHTILQWKENIDRSDLSLCEQIKNLNHMIAAWENESNKSISKRKLADLAGLKQTQALWYLNVRNETLDNSQFLEAIEKELLNSLQAAYAISQMESQANKNKLLQDLLSGKKIPFDQLLAHTKESGRTPTTASTTVKNALGLKVKSKIDSSVMHKILEILVSSDELKDSFNKKIKSNNKDMVAIWSQIYEVIKEKVKQDA